MTKTTDQTAERAAKLEAILTSTAPKKLIVAGPGTGKTYTFKQLFAGAPGANLALTFIRLLARGTATALGEVGESHTFHGYSRHLLHKLVVPGITPRFAYFPGLSELQADDIRRLESIDPRRSGLERAFHWLDDTEGLISLALRSGDYYDAVGYLDSVYRVFRHFESKPEDIPALTQLVVDEYQDFSRMEVAFIDTLGRRSPLLIVGDDDQALYSFKHASADFIRELANDAEFTKFELPFCTRCTEVLVAATHTVVTEAKKLGLLDGRLAKRYECFEPEKHADSLAYPKIVHADCSVERANAPYFGRYIEQQLLKIPPEHIAQSRAIGEPTVLIIGPNPFLSSVQNYLESRGWNPETRTASDPAVTIVDGLKQLLKNERSNLGWRILLFLDPVPELTDILRRVVADGAGDLIDLLPEAYRRYWLEMVRAAAAVCAASPITTEEVVSLEGATGLTLDELRGRLSVGDDEAGETAMDETPADIDTSMPSILMTNLVGAKGLQASHVFVVGLNTGHFPKGATPSDDEVCQLLVALTRARKQCTLISARRFGNKVLEPSLFSRWLRRHTRYAYVDRNFLEAAGSATADS